MPRLSIMLPVFMMAGSMLAGEAAAISRYQTMSMSCERVQAAVQSQGAAILHYPATDNPSLDRFDRYVRDRSFCSSGQKTQRTSVPAADTGRCSVNKCVRSGGNR